MSRNQQLLRAIDELSRNPEQLAAVGETGHCVVLAGPGSGKTKTLTAAMARALADDVSEPRSVACITYNNECAIELETRLARLGVQGGDRAFIGTVHGFALSQVIAPYARCVSVGLPHDFAVATRAETLAAVEAAYATAINGTENPHRRWTFASEKRRRDVDRSRPEWRSQNPELAEFIESYESELRRQGLIDFDDMPLLAYRMINEHKWIRDSVRARFPVLFVDEYQDLGHALHELVLMLCFEVGIRLFAVGDTDQSIYGFTGANPALLESLTRRPDVRTLRLRFNYRSGSKIVRASMGALGEERDYREISGAPEGEVKFWPVSSGLDMQAKTIASTIIPKLVEEGIALDEVAVLYRNANFGDKVAEALKLTSIPFMRTDKNAVVRRSSRLACLIQNCARWGVGGWRNADPRYANLLRQALALVYGRQVNAAEEQRLSDQLIQFLQSTINSRESTHSWLQRFDSDLIGAWRVIAPKLDQDWGVCAEMIANTDPIKDLDISLSEFSGHVEETGRVSLSTLHGAKGREFDAVVMYGVNSDDLPNEFDMKSAAALREARRLFYVGVTRPRKSLSFVYQKNHHSPWVKKLADRSRLP